MNNMTYLGAYKITPGISEIEVECYGIIEPAQKETLEQQGLSRNCIVENVQHNGTDITNYLSPDILDYLDVKVAYSLSL